MSPRKVWARSESGNPDVRFDDLLRLAHAFGFELARMSGSHHLLVHAELSLMLNLGRLAGRPSAIRSASWRRQRVSTD